VGIWESRSEVLGAERDGMMVGLFVEGGVTGD
jgi:hypothetical protein